MANDDIALELHPIHRALSRPNLLLGADRELVLITGLVCVILIFVVITPLALFIGLISWSLIVGLLRQMAKADPMMRPIYLRHIRYRPVYRATSTPFRRS